MSKRASSIVIIGAGLAGLTAAYRLHNKGYDVKVFEARNRVGGRIQSILLRNDDGNYSIGELGGQNITDGGKSKYILSLIQELGLDVKKHSVTFSRAFFYKQKLHDALPILQKHNFTPSTLKKTLDKLAKSSKSIQEVLNKLFPKNSILKRILTFQITAYEGYPPKLLSTFHNIETLKHGILGGVSQAHQAKNLSPKLYIASLKDGNATLPTTIAQKLHDKIHLNKVLKAAKLLKNKKIELTFTNSLRVLCDKLILAIPCSTYQNISFDHKLITQDRLKIIKDVQYGLNTKILAPIKDKNGKFNSILTDKIGAFYIADKKLLHMHLIRKTGKNLHHLWKYYSDMIKVIKLNFILSKSTNKKPIAAKDEQFTTYNGPVTKPWVSDPYSKGSYSNYGIKLGTYFNKKTRYKNIKVKTLFEPINDKVFFIGEHTTILNEIGTMEAAVESAERISRLFNHKKKS